MFIDGNLVPLAGMGVGLIITLAAITSSAITKYKLNVEQIKADAAVRMEDARFRNQLELEKLLHKDWAGEEHRYGNVDKTSEVSDDNRKVRERVID